MKLAPKMTALALLGALAASALSPALADPGSQQKNKNNWRNLGVVGAAVAGYGLLKHNQTATVLGAAGAAYSASRYEQDRHNQSQDNANRQYYYYGNNGYNNNGYNNNGYNNNNNNGGYNNGNYNNNGYPTNGSGNGRTYGWTPPTSNSGYDNNNGGYDNGGYDNGGYNNNGGYDGQTYQSFSRHDNGKHKGWAKKHGHENDKHGDDNGDRD